jgi:SAM-dependent methyltransferase
VKWRAIDRAVDLGCGTGRTGHWLKQQGVARIDGIDITPQMIAQAEARGIYAHLERGDVLHTPFADATYDLAAASLIDEHIRDLPALYFEASRIIKPGASFILVGYHPHFIMATGIPTHFDRSTGESVAIETHVHLLSHHVQAARRAGLALVEMYEQTVDQDWLAKKPKWQRFAGLPISFAFVLRRDN